MKKQLVGFTLILLGSLLTEVEANAIPIPNEYIECRSVRPIYSPSNGKTQYATVRVHRLGGQLGLVRYRGPVYTLANQPKGFQRTMKETERYSDILGRKALMYQFRNNSSAQLFELAIENPSDSTFPEERLAGHLEMQDGKPIGFSAPMNCHLVIPNL